MSPGTKAALAVTGIALGATAAYFFFGRESSSTASARTPNTASSGCVDVGYVSPSGGTRDWWHDRNHRRRNKHLKLMTAKG